MTATLPPEASARTADGYGDWSGPVRSARTRRPGSWPLQRVFAVGSALAALVGLCAIVLGALALYRLGEARRTLLDVVDPAQSAGQALSVALLNQEIGVRGFELASRPEFLEPYRLGLAAERDATDRLRALAGSAALSNLADDLGAVDQAVQRWHAGYVDRAVLVDGAPVDPLEGRALFGEVRVALADLATGLDEERVQARGRLDAAAAFVVAVETGIAVAMTALLVAVGIGLRRGVLAPVSELAARVRDVVSGDVTRKITPSGPPEIADLGSDVEAMRTYIVRELDAVQGANQRLDQQARDLERSNRDLEQFAYVASHDLQEPLRKVSSFCQLLQRRYGDRLDERGEQYIEFAVDGAQRMQRLINDVLAFSRVGRTTDGFEQVALADVAATVVAQLETTRAEVDGTIVVGDLPEVTGDPALLRQLLLNLVGNGLKFHRDGVPPEIHIDATLVEDAWETTVSDNGIGIEAEYVDKVFVIFQRLHGRDRYPGTGIGLALAKKIVEFHGGRITIDTGSEGPGTTVRFTLPARPQEDS